MKISQEISTTASAVVSHKGSAVQAPSPSTLNIQAFSSGVSAVSSLTPEPDSLCHCLPYLINPDVSLLYQTGEKQIVAQYQGLVHDFATHNNLPTRVVTAHSLCPSFQAMMQFAFKHGKVLAKHKNANMGKQAFNVRRKKEFTTLLAAIMMYCGEARDYYKEYCQSQDVISFASVGHDVWDSNKKECLGVTVSFYCPPRKKLFVIPVGLDVVEDKCSLPTAEQTLKILSTCGIEKCDVYKTTNDTTNSALATGRHLTAEGYQGTCAMHEIQLALQHATGLKTRTAKVDGKSKIVDEFPDCVEIITKAKLAGSYLMDKKSKGRFKNFRKKMEEMGRSTIKIVLPNSTRAGGVVIMFESLVRSRWNLHHYWHQDTTARDLTDDEFYLVSQITSVMGPINHLLRLVQTDVPGAIAYTDFLIFRTITTYMDNTEWYVADTRKSTHPDETDRWCPLPYPQRDHRGVPIGNLKTGSKKKDTLPLLKVATEDLDDMAKELIKRVVIELARYGKPTSDRLLAMACNPFMANVLADELDDFAAYVLLESDNQDSPHKEALDIMGNRERIKEAQDILVTEIRKVCGCIIPTEAGGAVPDSAPAPEAEQKKATGLKAIKQRKRALEAAGQQTRLEMTGDPVADQVRAFFHQLDFNPVSWIDNIDVSKEVGMTKGKWIENVQLVIKNFDVFKWWEDCGKEQFPLIYPIACRILALPDSNGGQERTFSAATWMDGKLNSQQSDLTFQMKVLLYKNQQFLNEHRVNVLEDNRKAAALKTKELLQQSMSGKDEDDNEETLGMLDAYEEDDEMKE